MEEFDKLVGRRPSPNLPALDTALVNTVSHWKRILAGELQAPIITQPISELFNAIFFVRATEDQRRKEHPNENFALLDEADRHTANPRTIRAILAATRRKVGSAPQSLRAHLWDESSLTTFDTLHPSTVRDLLSDFYYNRFAPYKYDFSLVSKHALSCIYEHYISQLKTVVPDQPLLFPEPAEEIPNRDLGGYYTPQYIAGFFARFLANAYTGPTFRQLKIADPACGSGMFLRTVLETQCDPIQNIDLTRIIPTAFANTLGIDVEPNACKAACLSLSLLHLVLTGDFPTKLNIVNDEALLYLSNQPQIHGSFDAVLANPPFVKWENIPLVWRPQVAALLEGFDAPKADLYMALLRIGLNMIRSGGYLLYVLPRTFLLAKNAQKLREHLIHLCWIHFLVDLSEIDVFEDASAYPILLILQKKPERDSSEPKAILVKCSAYPGNALEEALEGRTAQNEYFSISHVGQSFFAAPTWQIVDPKEQRVDERLARLPVLSTFALIKQGLITGQDKVFIRLVSSIPEEEKAAYIPYLSDREMQQFSVPRQTASVVFYPFAGEELLTEETVRRRFPKTWIYLLAHEEQLRNRKSLNRVGKHLWWRPLWPRPPRIMLQPKIVSPHLVLFPRFSLDGSGTYGVSHGPMVLQRRGTGDLKLMKYFLGVLNSSIGRWQIIQQSHKYQRGYAMLEVNTLQRFRIMSPAMVSPRTMNSILKAVDELIESPSEEYAFEVLDSLIAELHGIPLDDLQEIVLRNEKNVSENGSQQDQSR